MTSFLFFLQCIMVTRTVSLHNTLSSPEIACGAFSGSVFVLRWENSDCTRSNSPPAQKTTYQAAITSQKYIWSHINEAVCQVDVKKTEGRRREKLSEYFTDTSTPKLFWRWLPRLSDTSESAEAVWKLQSARACLEWTFLTNSKWHRWQPLFASPSVSGPRELASSCSEPVVQLRCNASAAHYVKSRHFFFSWQWVG